MEWNRLGDLLGRSLVGAAEGTSRGLDTLLAQKERNTQRDFEKNRRLDEIRLQEEMKQQAMAQREMQKDQQNQLFGSLLSAAQNGQITPDLLASISSQGILNPQMLTALSNANQKQERSALEREKFEENKRRFGEQQDLKRELQDKKLRYSEEAPQRKAVTQKVSETLGSLPFIEKEIGYYQSLKNLPQEKLRQGNWRKLLDKVGLGDMWQSPESDLAEKLISNIAVSQAQGATNFGQATNDKLALIQKSNPSLLQSPRGFRAAVEMNIRSKKVDKAIADEVAKIAKDSKGKYPLDIVSIAMERAKPKIEKLHKEQLEIANVLPYPIDIDQAVKFKVPEEVMQQLPNPLEVSKGDGIRDTDTGLIFRSDGNMWHIVEPKKG